MGVYDLTAHTTTLVAADETYGGKWLGDSRLVYFTAGGWQFVTVDTVTHKRTVIEVRLPAPATNEVFAIAPDHRTIYYAAARSYYAAARSEADIWIVEQKVEQK